MHKSKNADLLFNFKQKLLGRVDDIITCAGQGLHDYANAVCETAKEMAPRDTGELERDMHVEYISTNDNEIVFKVVADPIDEDGRHYGIEANYYIEPAGEWHLREESIRKQSSVDVLVGGEFIDRALIETKFDLRQYIKEAQSK